MAAGSIGRCHRHSILSTDVHARISHMCGNHGASPTLHTNHQPRMKSSRRSLGSDKTQVGSNKPVLVRKAHNTEMSNLRGSAGRFHHSGNFWNHPMPNDQMFGKRSYNMRSKCTVNESQSSPPCVSCRLAPLQPGHPPVFCERFQAWPSVHGITIPRSCRSCRGHHTRVHGVTSLQPAGTAFYQHSCKVF